MSTKVIIVQLVMMVKVQSLTELRKDLFKNWLVAKIFMIGAS